MPVPQKIFSAEQMRRTDEATIQREPVSSIDLMERAAARCAAWIAERYTAETKVFVFCGPGNNGGDGLAIARMLLEKKYRVTACVVSSEKHSPDFIANEKRLNELHASVVIRLHQAEQLPPIGQDDLVIDALFGTGLSKPVSGLAAACISAINGSKAIVVSIDLPSGMSADSVSTSASIVKARFTLTFQQPKLAFFFPVNSEYIGEWVVMDIRLDKAFIEEVKVSTWMLDEAYVSTLLRPRPKFSHKGTYGHALLVAGSYGKMGAAVLAVSACGRSGAGLVTAQVPRCGYGIIQISVPEAMALTGEHEDTISPVGNSEPYTSIGIGPGIGTDAAAADALHKLILSAKSPLVIDADAINLLGKNKGWLNHLPAGSILTPHPKEFERIAGTSSDDFARHQLQKEFSAHYNVYIVLKGANTCITSPGGEAWFNTSGNPGMAKGGSGDVLTGIITGILAQRYSPLEACLLGVFVHGLAGDLAAQALGETGMKAGDLVTWLPQAFSRLSPAN